MGDKRQEDDRRFSLLNMTTIIRPPNNGALHMGSRAAEERSFCTLPGFCEGLEKLDQVIRLTWRQL